MCVMYFICRVNRTPPTASHNRSCIANDRYSRGGGVVCWKDSLMLFVNVDGQVTVSLFALPTFLLNVSPSLVSVKHQNHEAVSTSTLNFRRTLWLEGGRDIRIRVWFVSSACYQGTTAYPNTFLEAGRKLIWFPGPGQTERHPVVRKLLDLPPLHPPHNQVCAPPPRPPNLSPGQTECHPVVEKMLDLAPLHPPRDEVSAPPPPSFLAPCSESPSDLQQFWRAATSSFLVCPSSSCCCCLPERFTF